MATLQIYPAMPEIGHPESYYARLAKHADHVYRVFNEGPEAD